MSYTAEKLYQIETELRLKSEALAKLQDMFADLTVKYEEVVKERDDFALLIFQPCGESHHNADKCPYCQENKEKL